MFVSYSLLSWQTKGKLPSSVMVIKRSDLTIPNHVNATLDPEAEVVDIKDLQSKKYLSELSYRENKGLVVMLLSVKHHSQLSDSGGKLMTSASGRSGPGGGSGKKSRTSEWASRTRKYDRFLMMAELSSPTSKCICHILPDSLATLQFFTNKCFGLRQEGIGDIFWIEEPHPVQSCLGSTHYVPIIESETSVFPVELKMKDKIAEVEPSNPNEGETKYFVKHGEKKLEIGFAAIVPAICLGSFCDQQSTLMNKDVSCGCLYKARNKCANMLEATIKIPVKQTFSKMGEEVIKHFQSWHFSQLFVDPDCWTEVQWEDRDHQKLLRKAVKDIVTYVNDKGGWTYVGWLRKGKTSNNSDASSSWNFASISTVPHLSYLYPSEPKDVSLELNKAYTDLLLDSAKLREIASSGDSGKPAASSENTAGDSGKPAAKS